MSKKAQTGRVETNPATGFLSHHGKAIGYDDIQGPASAGKKPPSSSPTDTTYNFGIGGGVAFGVQRWNIGDYLEWTFQTTHATAILAWMDEHIHWTVDADSGDKFKFQVDMIGAGIGEDFAVPTGSPFTKEFTLTGVESGRHNLLDLADIPPINSTVSSLIIARLTRIAASSDELGDELYVLFHDIHAPQDTPAGSAEEGSKWGTQ
jgi:hypothetical protein